MHSIVYWAGPNRWLLPGGPVQQTSEDLLIDDNRTLCWHMNFLFFTLIDQFLFSQKEKA